MKKFISIFFAITLICGSLCLSGCCDSKEVESEKKVDIDEIVKQAKVEAEKAINESNAEEKADTLMKEILNDKE